VVIDSAQTNTEICPRFLETLAFRKELGMESRAIKGGKVEERGWFSENIITVLAGAGIVAIFGLFGVLQKAADLRITPLDFLLQSEGAREWFLLLSMLLWGGIAFIVTFIKTIVEIHESR
jgi:hypothetical protein